MMKSQTKGPQTTIIVTFCRISVRKRDTCSATDFASKDVVWGLPALSKDPCSEMANVKLVADIFLAYSKRPGQESAFELQVRARNVTIQVGKTNSYGRKRERRNKLSKRLWHQQHYGL